MALGMDVNPAGTKLFAVHFTFFIIAWFFVLLRCHVRVSLIKNVAADDYLMFAAMLVYTAYSISAFWGIIAGATGEHASTLRSAADTARASISLEAWYLCEVLYAPLSICARTSISIFLLRIAQARLHRYIIYATLVVIWVLSLAYFFITMLQCSPPSYFWEHLDPGQAGSCINPNVVPSATVAYSIVGASCDFVLAFLPIAILWSVQLNKRMKATIAMLLSLGFLAGIALLVRIPYVRFLAISKDFLYETIDVAIWSTLEPSLGIIAGCAATLRPLAKAWGFRFNSSARYADAARYDGPGRPKACSHAHAPVGARGTGARAWGGPEHVEWDHDHGDGPRHAPAHQKPHKTSSDIELVKQEAGATSPRPSAAPGDWEDVDLEQALSSADGDGDGDGDVDAAVAVAGRTQVHVQTRVEVTCHHLSDEDTGSTRPQSSLSPTRRLFQGERVVTIRGSGDGLQDLIGQAR